MPKATRAKEGKETPKQRSRKAKPADGIGTEAVEPLSTAPATAEVKSEAGTAQEQEAPKKRTRSAKAVETIGPNSTEPSATKPVAEHSFASTSHNGHVPEELVRRRAYELYLQRRGQGGSPEQDWFQALQEIQGQHVA